MNKFKDPLHSMALILIFHVPVDKRVCWLSQQQSLFSNGWNRKV